MLKPWGSDLNAFSDYLLIKRYTMLDWWYTPKIPPWSGGLGRRIVLGQPGLHSKTLPQKNKNHKNLYIMKAKPST
jgi:hypothetical protein